METSKNVASKAAKILSDPKSTPAQKSVAASDLSQYKTDRETTSAKVASQASRILSDPRSTSAQKSVAASDLAQRQGASKSPRKK